MGKCTDVRQNRAVASATIPILEIVEPISDLTYLPSCEASKLLNNDPTSELVTDQFEQPVKPRPNSKGPLKQNYVQPLDYYPLTTPSRQ
jgi:hypothetical protein